MHDRTPIHRQWLLLKSLSAPGMGGRSAKWRRTRGWVRRLGFVAFRLRERTRAFAKRKPTKPLAFSLPPAAAIFWARFI